MLLGRRPIGGRLTRVLLADDNEDVLESTTMLLEVLGFEVVGVLGSAEIVAAARASRPDVVLQDVQMPGLDLAHVVRELKALRAPSPSVLLFTADATAEDLAVRVGADGVVQKPFDGGRIKQVLETAAHAGST